MPSRIPVLEDADLQGKRVLTRVDFNVPMRDGAIVDDRRIVAALPTLQYLQGQGAKTIVVTHFGRPKGKSVPELSTKPLAERLAQHLGRAVAWCPAVVGDEVTTAVDAMRPGDVLMLENVRFEPGEEANDPGFAKKLAANADIWCMDAFGTAHRAHASTEGVGHLLPGVAGRLMAREIEVLSGLFTDPQRPLLAIVGGAKISTKIGVLRNLLTKVDQLWVGGAMASTFLRARGLDTGRSLVEDDQVAVARDLLTTAGDKLRIPVDALVSDRADAASSVQTMPVEAIPSSLMMVDVGPATVEAMRADIAGARTIVWNGPLGVYEIEEYSHGTRDVAEAVAESDGMSVIGGGDLAAALDQAGIAGKISHVSTGGGATLEYLEGKQLPGITVLQQQKVPAR